MLEVFPLGRRGTPPRRRQHDPHASAVGGEYLVEAVGEGSRLTYTLWVELRGLWGVAVPYLRRSGPRTMARSLRTLKELLGGGTGPPPVRR
jgi:hypothetical protein